MTRKCFMLGLLLVMGCLSIQVSYSQPIRIPVELQQQLQGKQRLDEIMPVVDRFYTRDILNLPQYKAKDLERQHKFWKRWEWYVEGRLGPQGEFVNISERLHNLSKHRMLKPISGGISQYAPSPSSGNWTSIGPGNVTKAANLTDGIGRVDRLAFHPSDPDYIYAGTTSGGLWRSSNGGSTWSAISDNITSMGISGIVVSHSNANVLYILTGDGDSNLGTGGFVQGFNYIRTSIGVLKSTDGGSTWNPTGAFPGVPSNYYGYTLIQDPNNANTLIAATSVGLFRTTNGGTSWALVSPNSNKYYDAEFRPGSSDTVYACTGSVFYRSTNGGASFSSAGITYDVALGATDRLAIAVTPAAPNRVYLLAGPNAGLGAFRGLYRSTNYGEDFFQRTNTPNIVGGDKTGADDGSLTPYALCIAVSPSSSNTLVTGSGICWRSTDGGATMTNSSHYFAESSTDSKYVHPDIHDLAYNPLNGNLYVANDGGVYRSTDNGVSWTELSNTLRITQVYHMAGYDGDANRILLGTQDNGTLYRSSNTSTFSSLYGCDGHSVMIDHEFPDTLYYGCNRVVRRSYDNGATSTDVTPGGVSEFYPQLAMHPTNSSIIYMGFTASVFRSADRGNNWTDKGVNGRWCLATCPSNGSRVYAAGGSSWNGGSGGGLRRSDDQGDTWDLKSDNPGFPGTFTKITDIAVEPDNSLHVWVTIGGFTDGVKVYYSADGGDNWVNRSGNLPNLPVNCVAVDASNNAYIGTDLGVFYLPSGDTDWTPFYNNLAQVPVTELVINTAAGKIRAATFGRGVWESPLYSTCVVNLNVTETLAGQYYFEASNSLTSTSLVFGSQGTNAYFKAGSYIDLLPGFEARTGNFFQAYLGPCSAGLPAGFSSAEPTNSKDEEMIMDENAVVTSLNKTASFFVMNRDKQTLQAELTNTNGRVVRQWAAENDDRTIEHRVSVKGEGLPSGMYLCNLKNSSGKLIATKKVMIQ